MNRRITIHATFWLLWGFINSLAMISQQSLSNKIMLGSFVVIQGATIYYTIMYFAFPNLVSPKRFILGIFVLFLVYCLNYVENLGFNILGLKYNYFTPKSYSYEYAQLYVKKGFWGILKPQNIFFEFYMAMTSVVIPFLLKFSRLIVEYSTKVTRLIKEKTDLEIDFLRTQLNPHFLLNSLNNIYSQVVSKDETAADSIVSLSDSMKYILYNSGEPLVDLESEIHFLKNYVDLQKLKGDSHLDIRFKQEGKMEGYKIAPLILINYLENAFKHTTNATGETCTINIDIKFENDVLHFKIENDAAEKNDANTKNKGVGMINTKRRLDLLYANNHGLQLSNKNNVFKLDLWIKLNKE